METQTYYFSVNTKWPNSGPNYANNDLQFYKIAIDEKNINIYGAPHPRYNSWNNGDKLPSDDKFTNRIESIKGSVFTNKNDEISLDILVDNIPISDYYRNIIHERILPNTYDGSYSREISYYYNYYYIIKFLVDMKISNKREYLSKKTEMKAIAENEEFINDMIEKYKNPRSDGYIEGWNTCMDMKSESLIKLEQKHSEMKNYFQNKIKNLNVLNDELQKLNSLLKREIKIARLENASNELNILKKFEGEVLDKELYLQNELKNSDKNSRDKVEISNKIKIINELYDELAEKIRVLNVKIDPTTSTRRGTEYAGSDCYICDDYCHYYCSCDCHDNDSEQEEPITVKKFEYKGKKYKLSSDNTLYDWDNDEPIGIWNPKTKMID